MATNNFFGFIVLSVLVAVVSGYDLRGKQQMGTPTPEECMKPPMSKFGHECCRLPKERIWGDLRKSLNLCVKKIRQPMGSKQEMGDDDKEMVTPGGSDMITPTQSPTDAVSTPTTSSTTPNHHGMPHGKKSFSERVKQLFTSVYKEIKNTFTSIWQSVVIITDHMRRHGNDSCFMECVFEDQGFLVDKMINKVALIDKFSETLKSNLPWHNAAVAAVEVCYQATISNPPNGTCNSGSEQMFRCVFKQLFFNCPNWTQNDYCKSLKEFYQKCPNGPPPEMDDNHSTTSEPEDDEESESSTDKDAETK